MLLDYAAAAEYLSTTERHVRDLQQRRELTSVRVGRLVRFRKAVERQQLGPPEEAFANTRDHVSANN